MLGKRPMSTERMSSGHGARAARAQLGLDRQRHLVARRQLVDEPLAAGVEQGRALAAHGLGDEEPVARAVAHERGGMELRELEVGEVGARRVRQRQPDADRPARVGGARPERGGAAGGEHGAPGGDRRARRRRARRYTPRQRPPSTSRAVAVVCSSTSMRSWVAASGGELAGDSPAGGGAARVHDPACRVAALQAEGERAAAVGVEAHAERLELAEPGRASPRTAPRTALGRAAPAARR